MHAPTAQAPDAHTVVVVLASAHERPQAPQCAAVVSTLVSQPLLAMPSQSSKPAAHA